MGTGSAAGKGGAVAAHGLHLHATADPTHAFAIVMTW